MASKQIITTYACGCVSSEEKWSLCEDVHKEESTACYHCRVIAPRPEIGATTEFLRFGLPPASGQSFNHRDNFHEVGVSAYAIVGDRVLQGPGLAGFLARPAYVGVGIVVGYGSDDEILVEIQSLKKISDKKAMKLAGYGS